MIRNISTPSSNMEGADMAHETTKDLELDLWGSKVTLPQGTKVRLIKGASGTRGDLYAVDSVKDLIALTGNAHDPRYRYAFVPTDAVAEAAPEAPAPARGF